MNGAPNSGESQQAAIAEIQQLLGTDPAQAAEKAAAVLAAVPADPAATFYLGIARRLMGDASGSVKILETMAREQPDSADIQYELGRSFAAANLKEQAIVALQRAVELQPVLPGAWNILAFLLRDKGDEDAANAVCAERIGQAPNQPRLVQADAAMQAGRIKEAEGLLREQLANDPTDVVAMRMLAEIGVQFGMIADAGFLLQRALELAPNFAAARYDYAVVLQHRLRPGDAIREIEQALEADPDNPGYRQLQAVLLDRVGDYNRAIDVFESLLTDYPNQPRTSLNYGHTLQAAGLQAESIGAFRRSKEINPTLGEAWWSLADMKTFSFTPEEVAEIREHLAGFDLEDEDRMYFEFALGKALEDGGEYQGSFEHYAEGNRLCRATLGNDSAEITTHVQHSKALFTPTFFADRKEGGSPAADPIFIVGMPRSGSTLVEQILASHPDVEGTMELQDVNAIVRELGEQGAQTGNSVYPGILDSLDPGIFKVFGERYLETTRIQRKTDRANFTDKLPNNFLHVGLIHLMLPNARIVDVRRHPLACCLSNFKQHFAQGQRFTYDLAELGRYYADYIELMAHWDEVLPERVHRTLYEELVSDTETEVRRLLDYCGLPFDERCLDFHKNERAIRTPSSEQVRQPIYQNGINHWQYYDSSLDPLREALGPVLESYPQIPDFNGRTAE